jgi:bis(5'-nucleosyl)-tetraphosphatase (symmetrical)
MSKRTIFIWDVHWCYDELKLLIKKLKLTKNDRVFFVWDYINKWPKSYKVLKYIYKNRKQFFWVLWNHDYNFLKWLEWNNLTFIWEDIKKIIQKMDEHPKILKYFKKMPLYIEEDNFILIHWWLNPEKKLEKQTPLELTSTREISGKPWYKSYKWKKKIIYGHWALQWINIRKNTIWLDSGCCYWKYLTAYILETWELIQQKALKTYVEI